MSIHTALAPLTTWGVHQRSVTDGETTSSPQGGLSYLQKRSLLCCSSLISFLLPLPPRPCAQITCKEIAQVSAEAVLQKPPQWQDVSIRGRPVCQKILHNVMESIWAGERQIWGPMSHLTLCQGNIKGISQNQNGIKKGLGSGKQL